MKKGSSYSLNKNIISRARPFEIRVFVAGLCFVWLAGLAQAKNSPSKQISAPIVPLNPDLDSSKPVDRLSALEAYKNNHHKISSAKLKAKLKTEKDPLVRLRLNQALAASDSPDVVVMLGDALQNDADPMVREGAAESLAKFARNDGAAKILADALSNEKTPSVRQACALSLSLSDSSMALTALERASKDSDPIVRGQIAFGLKRQTNKKAQQILKALKSDSDASVRAVAGGKN